MVNLMIVKYVEKHKQHFWNKQSIEDLNKNRRKE